jgi:cation transport protein ChaC
MTLSRRDLELNRMRSLYAQVVDEKRALSDEQLSASLTATLAAKPPGAGWWVFGYGSLLWNPLFPVSETRLATVRGLHRRFCLWSLASRGTPEQPGLVLGLDRGGTCRGLALRLPAPLAIDELHLLWRREMVVGAYEPRWVSAEINGGTRIALAFVVRRDHPQYAGRMSVDDEARVIGCACGAFGSSLEYLHLTRAALAEHGIADRYLDRLAAKTGMSAGAVPGHVPIAGEEPPR